MRVILINPPVLDLRIGRGISPVAKRLFFNSPPLGIAYLAAVLEKNEIPVSIIDAAVENLSITALCARIKEYAPDIVGLTSTTNLFDSAVVTAGRIKEILPRAKLVLGGSHISANPRHAFSSGFFDAGVRGEGEITFLELIKAFETGRSLEEIKGLVFRKGESLHFTPPREFVEDLDQLPLPARHLLAMEKYISQPNDQYRLPKLSMIASRGCPYGCIFCDKNVFGRRYRSFSPTYIVSEMQCLVSEYGARDIAVLDSTFTVSIQRVEGIIEEMKRQNLKVNWTCTVRADMVSYELLKKMREAGCWRVRLGVESGSDEVLAFIKKGITREQVKNAARWAHKLGLQPKGFFMIGHLVDTRETINETMRFARSLPLKDITLQINTPMPNTEQYDYCKDYGTFAVEDFKDFSYWEPVFIPRGLSRDYLTKAFRRFYRSFYLRPVIFWRHLCSIRSGYDLVKYALAAGLVFALFFRRTKPYNK